MARRVKPVWWVFGITVLVCLGICGLGGFVLWQALLGGADAAARDLPKEVAAARREGLPLTSEELFVKRPIDPNQNAGPTLANESEAVRKVVTASTSRRVFGSIATGKAGPSELKEAKLLLSKVGPQIDAIVAAAKLPACDFGKDYGLGAKVLFPEFANLKNVVRVLVGRANIAARRGDWGAAERDLVASFRIADMAGREPCLIGALVQIALNAITHTGLRQILKERGGDSRAIAMGERLSRRAVHVDFRAAFKGDFVLGLSTLRSIKNMREVELLAAPSERTDGSGPPGFYADGFVGRFKDAWQARYIQFHRRMLARMPRDPQDYLALEAVLKEETAREEAHNDLSYLMNKILIPTVDQAARAAARDLANEAVSEGYWRLLAYGKQHGSFPEKLGDLGSPPIDPFDGKPLKYRKQGKGFLLYSVDRDGKDDGGRKERPKGIEGGTADLVADYP
ncbi:MAG: hypothetical protein HZC36_10180 [Armatimonadetes bacterium]|nr:hypothetical protein [Armatimonadota bacterium]